MVVGVEIDGSYVLDCGDDGVGIPGDAPAGAAALTIIRHTAQQIGGTLETRSTGGGMTAPGHRSLSPDHCSHSCGLPDVFQSAVTFTTWPMDGPAKKAGVILWANLPHGRTRC